MEGLFITFEGGEGSGKDCQVEMLAGALRALDYAVTTTREPGGTRLGERLREMVKSDTARLDPRTELMMMMAARAQHAAYLLRPALNAGDVVLCNRYVDSSVAYQGYGRGLSIADIEHVAIIATDNLFPDLTVLLDLDPRIGLERAFARVAAGDKEGLRFETEALAFHERVREGYLQISREEPDRFLVLDATRPPLALHQEILDRALDLLRYTIEAPPGLADVFRDAGEPTTVMEISLKPK